MYCTTGKLNALCDYLRMQNAFICKDFQPKFFKVYDYISKDIVFFGTS